MTIIATTTPTCHCGAPASMREGDYGGVCLQWPLCEKPKTAAITSHCSCARNSDGSVTTFLCPVHATSDPCLTMSQVTGRRRHGTIKHGRCTSCGWSA